MIRYSSSYSIGSAFLDCLMEDPIAYHVNITMSDFQKQSENT